ncbi:hypothetical protein RJT34_33045 [Clitoria ternatea]|uniref:Uncharacterized protein n=1 Tax=Clitoria ternatea TaxID=43366 RepID=A0AAN9F1C0_CLITE
MNILGSADEETRSFEGEGNTVQEGNKGFPKTWFPLLSPLVRPQYPTRKAEPLQATILILRTPPCSPNRASSLVTPTFTSPNTVPPLSEPCRSATNTPSPPRPDHRRDNLKPHHASLPLSPRAVTGSHRPRAPPHVAPKPTESPR